MRIKLRTTYKPRRYQAHLTEKHGARSEKPPANSSLAIAETEQAPTSTALEPLTQSRIKQQFRQQRAGNKMSAGNEMQDFKTKRTMQRKSGYHHK